MSADAEAQFLQYVEDRLTLIEQMFSQLFAFLPADAAEALASEYNNRRTACILKHCPDADLPKPAEPSRLILPH